MFTARFQVFINDMLLLRFYQSLTKTVKVLVRPSMQSVNDCFVLLVWIHNALRTEQATDCTQKQHTAAQNKPLIAHISNTLQHRTSHWLHTSATHCSTQQATDCTQKQHTAAHNKPLIAHISNTLQHRTSHLLHTSATHCSFWPVTCCILETMQASVCQLWNANRKLYMAHRTI